MPSTQPWKIPVNILDPDADEQIRNAGAEARRLSAQTYNLICTIHGLIAQSILAEQIDEIEGTHRNAETCLGLIRPQAIK
jgi:hypothetical protein